MIAEYSCAMTSALDIAAARHLLRADGQEDLCFAVWFPSRGRSRTSALIVCLLLPHDGERNIHGNASFNAAYLERAVFAAAAQGGGLAFIHSHPFPGWQAMSPDDVRAEERLAPQAYAVTGLPLIGLTLGNDGAWSARFWERTGPYRYERHWCASVRVVGDALAVTYGDTLRPRPRMREEFRRTVSAWGEAKQADLARLRFGVIGGGSVGEIVAEALARMGIQEVVPIDYDRFETHNRDRSLHANADDARMRRKKVDVIARSLRESATAKDFLVRPIDASVVEDDGFRAALDCDVLFSCVDRPWARHVLNFIAYAHLIPVIDGGIRVDTNARGLLQAADWRAHIAGPGHRCLLCIGQYTLDGVQLERDGYLDDPSYIRGLPKDSVLRRNENVFAFSLSTASFQILQMLSMVVAPLGIANVGEQLYHFVPGLLDPPIFKTCASTCPFQSLIGKGNRAGVDVTGRDRRAEAMRQSPA